MPVSEDEFNQVRTHVEDLRMDMAVRAETQRSIEKRLDAIESVLSRLTWLIVTAVVTAVIAMVVYSGGTPGVTG